jgi:hypothetical protein
VPESTGTATRLVRGDPTATPIAETIPIDARTSDARIAPTGRQSEAARIATAPPVLASTGTATRLVRGDPNSLTFSFDGAINGRSVDILVDSGAYLSFLSEDFYREHLAATRQQATTDVPVTLADGTPYTVNTVVRTKLRINQPYGHPYETVVQLHVLPMRNGYDLLLGEPFLREMHVVLSYESNSMAIRRGERWITLYSAAARPIVSPKTFNRLVGTIADGRLCHPTHVSEHPSDDFPLISDTDGPCGAIHFIPGPVPDSNTPENESPLPDARPVLAVTDAAPASPGTSATSEADSALADLSPADASFVRGLQHQYPGVFDGTSQAHTTGATKRAHAVTHSIKLQAGTEPVAASFRRMSPQMLGELQKQLATFLANGEIEPARGPWASPILFVRKKNGTYRFCVDYRALNAKTIKDRYPLPRMEDCLDQLRGACYFTALDLQSGYHQVPMAEKSKPLTAFTCRYGTYQFRVMPFGLTNAPATFQAWMNDILRPFLDRFVVVYLDDILIYSRTEEEHRRHLTDVMRALEDAGARLNLAKCKFFQDQTTFLGHIVTRQGVHTDPRLVAKIRENPRPTSKKDVRSFLGVVNYYRRFIQGCAQISAPLYDLTDNSHAPMTMDGRVRTGVRRAERQTCDRPSAHHRRREQTVRRAHGCLSTRHRRGPLSARRRRTHAPRRVPFQETHGRTDEEVHLRAGAAGNQRRARTLEGLPPRQRRHRAQDGPPSVDAPRYHRPLQRHARALVGEDIEIPRANRVFARRGKRRRRLLQPSRALGGALNQRQQCG